MARADSVYQPEQRSLPRVQPHRERYKQKQPREQVQERLREAGPPSASDDPEKHSRRPHR